MASGKVWSRKRFFPGEQVFEEGDNARSAYIVESGQIEIYSDASGTRTHYATVGKNGLFGELALIDKGRRSASAVAIEDTICLVLNDGDFEKVLERTDPFLRKMVMLLSERLRKANELGSMT